MVRKRVWLNTPYHNYTDKKKYLLSDEEIEQYKMYEEENTHWNYGDFVNSSCVTKPGVAMFASQPNYMIVYNSGEIEARYYVTGFQFLSGEVTADNNKFNASLIRDVIVDFKGDVASNMFKCRRGSLPRDVYNPILVQPEGLTLNQIKKAQKKIESWDKDTRWLTLFYSTQEEKTIEFDWENTVADYAFGTMESDYGTFTLNTPPATSDNSYNRYYTTISRRYRSRIEAEGTFSPAWVYDVDFTINISYNNIITVTDFTFSKVSGSFNIDSTDKNSAIDSISNRMKARSYSSVTSNVTQVYNKNNTSNYNFIRNKYDSRIVASGTDQYFSTITSSEGPISATSTDTNGLWNVGGGWTMWYGVQKLTTTASAPSSISDTTVSLYEYRFSTFFNLVPQSGSLVLPVTRRLDEINLSCITIPFGDDVSIKDGSNIYSGISKYAAMSIATTGWTKLGDTVLDIQILPYCPQSQLNSLSFQNVASNQIDITDLTSDYKKPMVTTSTSNTIYFGLVCDQSSMDYRYPINISEYQSDLKLDSMTKKFRLYSQDHKQSFEFNPALNNGLEALSISYTLRPLTTIFRISPVFKGASLYGGNYADSRGLIWQGGFSLSQIKNDWVQYKLQNSTYQQIFNSEIQHLEVSQENARAQESLSMQTSYANAQTGIDAQAAKAALGLGMGVGASMAGMATGNPMAVMGGIGALAGGVSAGIGLGASQEIADRNLQASKEAQGINDSQRNADLAYKRDVWNLNMQAIQARPNSMTSNTEHSIINELKAYIEIYDCSEEEKIFVENYLKYHGMKIEQIGSPSQYLVEDGDYIEGTMYFATGLTPAIANALNAELNSGMYVQKDLFNMEVKDD